MTWTQRGLGVSWRNQISTNCKILILFIYSVSFGFLKSNSNIYLTEIMYIRYSVRSIVKLNFIANIYQGLMLDCPDN